MAKSKGKKQPKKQGVDKREQISYHHAQEVEIVQRARRSTYDYELCKSFEESLDVLDRRTKGRFSRELAEFWEDWKASVSDNELGRELGFYRGGPIAEAHVKRFRMFRDYRVAYFELHSATPPRVLFLAIYDRQYQDEAIAACLRILRDRGLLNT